MCNLSRTRYRIGYAESIDRINGRKDFEDGLTCRKTLGLEMVAYPLVLRHGDRLRMLYNGTTTWRTGIGLARHQ